MLRRRAGPAPSILTRSLLHVFSFSEFLLIVCMPPKWNDFAPGLKEVVLPPFVHYDFEQPDAQCAFWSLV